MTMTRPWRRMIRDRLLVAAGTSFLNLFRRAARGRGRASALALLVTRVRANDHDPPVAPDDPALLADPLDARLDLHGVPFSLLLTCSGRQCVHDSGRREKAPP